MTTINNENSLNSFLKACETINKPIIGNDRTVKNMPSKEDIEQLKYELSTETKLLSADT